MTSSRASKSVAASSAPSAAAGRMAGVESVVCFVVAGRTFALDVSLVREVYAVPSIFPVPRAPAPVIGVFSLRGATVALVDTSLLLRFPRSEESSTALVIVKNHQTICGMTIDRVLGVTRFVEGTFIAADPEREPAEVVGFMPDERGGLLTVLDSSAIVSALTRLRIR